MLQGYSELLLQWEKREAEGEIAARQAEKASIPQLWGPGVSAWFEELSVIPRVVYFGSSLSTWGLSSPPAVVLELELFAA